MSEPAKPRRRESPQWSNSYEAQLSDGELQWLHSALLARSPSDKEIISKLPPWRSGPRKGQPPSKSTLSNIRDRLEMEENFQAAEQTAESIIDQLKREVPELSQEQLDQIAHRTFSLMAIRQGDPQAYLKLATARFKAELEAEKLKLRQREAERAEEALALEKQRFMRDSAELFLKWVNDQLAKEIAASALPNSEKIEALGQQMFGELWQLKPSQPS